MNRLDVARRAAEAGAEVAMSFARKPRNGALAPSGSEAGSLRRWTKPDGSLVTEADLAAERAVIETLHHLAPGEPVLAEESGGADTLENTWIVDPIDGTENFNRRIPVWATLVAWHGSASEGVTAAAVNAPALGRQWWAELGGGAFGPGGRIHVSDVRDPSSGCICVGGLHEYAPDLWERVADAAAEFHTAWGWGNFWGHMLVAEGSVEAALSSGTQVWDVAAASLIVTEAGGRWTDLRGVPDLRSGSFLSGNAELHRPLLHSISPQGHGTLVAERQADSRQTERKA